MATKKSEAAMKKRLGKKIRKIHPVTRAVAVIFLLCGVAAGVFLSFRISRNDRFILKGENTFSVDVGDTYFYTEQGAEAVCFGRDLSDRVTVKTDLQKDGEGRYIIPTDKEGVYTITYAVDCYKFGEKAPNGQILRIRTFTVSATGEEDRDDTEE